MADIVKVSVIFLCQAYRSKRPMDIYHSVIVYCIKLLFDGQNEPINVTLLDFGSLDFTAFARPFFEDAMFFMSLLENGGKSVTRIYNVNELKKCCCENFGDIL